MLNKKFIQQKIGLIQQDLVYMEKLSHFSFQEIVNDFIRMNAFERLLEKIVARAIDINEHFINELATPEMRSSQSYKETFLRLVELNVYPQDFTASIVKSVGTRNALTHDYDELDLQKIYSSAKECLEDYTKYCGYILQFLEEKIIGNFNVTKKDRGRTLSGGETREILNQDIVGQIREERHLLDFIEKHRDVLNTNTKILRFRVLAETAREAAKKQEGNEKTPYSLEGLLEDMEKENGRAIN